MKHYYLNDLIISKNQGINTTTEKIKYTASGHIVLRAKNILDGKIDLSDIVFVDDKTYLNSNDIFKPHINDVLYTNIGSQFGNSCVVKCKDFFITWNILRLTPKTSIVLPDYLSYLLNMNRERLRNLNSSSTMPFVSGNVLGQQIFMVHEPLMQQHIVDTIGSLDDLIEQYETIINKIDNYLTLQFKLLKKNEGLKFSNICKCYNGGTFKSTDYVVSSVYKLITIKNIDASGFSTDSPTYIPPMPRYEKYKLKIGDILLTMTGAYLGRSGIVDEENCYLNQRVLKIECDSKAFLYCFLKMYQNDIFALGKGSAQQNLSLTDLNNFHVNYSLKDIIDFQKNDSYIQFILYYKIKIKLLKNIKQQYLKKFFG